MLKVSDLDFMGHFSRIELNVKFFGNNLNQTDLDIITEDRGIVIWWGLELLKDVHENLVVVDLIELVIVVGFMFWGWMGFIDGFGEGVEGSAF